MVKTCFDLATALTAAYHSPVFHDPRSYGVIISMCMPNCVINPGIKDHIAASWIHETVGANLIPTRAAYGIVLDQNAIDILCVSPIDLMSDARDDQGCGPNKMDPEYGSIGKMNVLQRYFFRRGTTKYKNLNFGKETNWSTIPCAPFFFNQPILESMDAILDIEEPSSAVKPLAHVIQDQYQTLLGHPVCNASRVSESKYPIPVYAGRETWSIEDWPYIVSQQQKLQETYHRLWNELVIRLPDQMNHVVQAVIYRSAQPNEPPFLEARQLADLLRRPIMEMQTDVSGNTMFVCREEVVDSLLA